MRYLKYIVIIAFAAAFLFAFDSCNYTTHRTYSGAKVTEGDDPEPDYDVSLNDKYQDFVSYIFMGNRSESFGTFFNKFFTALEDYDEALIDYRATTIAAYNRRLDSLNITPPISASAKEKLNKVIERCSKIIQYNKNTRFLDDAVLLIGKSYYFLGDYYQAERKFAEFLSKLTSSAFSDEAMLYLGITKFKLSKNDEGETILKNLLAKSPDNDVKSEAAQELGIYELSKKNYSEALKYFKNSILLAKDKEKKAEKQYILAKIISTYDKQNAYKDYQKAIDYTSDFDLTFYSKLNYAKSLDDIENYDLSFKVLDKLESKYRDYPELKQLVEFEIANNFYARKKTKEAIIKYFEIIIDYPGTMSAADSYYRLAKHYEDVEKNYLKALVNYKKVVETNGSSDYARISDARANTLDKYFGFLAGTRDTTKGAIPTVNQELEKHRLMLEDKRGIKRDKEGKLKEKEKEKENEGKFEPKGGGEKGFDGNPLDSIKKDIESEKIDNEGNPIAKGKTKNDSLKKFIPTDSTKNLVKDPLEIKNDSLKSGIDSVKAPPVNLDSIKAVKELEKLNSYYGLAELFLYELDRVDSAEIYLKEILSISENNLIAPKVMYTLATLYKNQGREAESKQEYEKIISNYPASLFANEARKVLGMNVIEIELDPADSLYKEAEQKFESKDYTAAMNMFNNIKSKYPDSKLMPKIYYSLGWLNENIFFNKDSMVANYKKLKELYPASEYISDITPKLDYFASLEKKDSVEAVKDSTSLIPDSLKVANDSLKILKDKLNITDSLSVTDTSSVKEKKEQKSKDENTGEETPPQKKKIPEKMLNPNEEKK